MKTFTTDIPQPCTCPDCLGPGCCHCRERRAAAAERRRRSKLTDEDRRLLEIFVRTPRYLCPPPVARKAWTGLPVLPANFSL